jgi:hypothetical protein
MQRDVKDIKVIASHVVKKEKLLKWMLSILT